MVKRLLLLVVFAMAGGNAFAQTELQRQISLISRAYPEILVMGIVYNSRTHQNLSVPTHVGSIRLIAIPINCV